MKKEIQAAADEKFNIEDDVGRYWCRVIESISAEVFRNMVRSINTEQFAEVVITGVNQEQNTVNCRNIQTGEVLNAVPNYSNISTASLINEDGSMKPYPTRGRVFITSIKDNPVYLGAWYN